MSVQRIPLPSHPGHPSYLVHKSYRIKRSLDTEYRLPLSSISALFSPLRIHLPPTCSPAIALFCFACSLTSYSRPLPSQWLLSSRLWMRRSAPTKCWTTSARPVRWTHALVFLSTLPRRLMHFILHPAYGFAHRSIRAWMGVQLRNWLLHVTLNANECFLLLSFRRLLGSGLQLRHSNCGHCRYEERSWDVRYHPSSSTSLSQCNPSIPPFRRGKKIQCSGNADYRWLANSISGTMTGALSIYSATFMRYALAVQPKNYLLFACHMINFCGQTTQGYRWLQYYK